MGVRALLPVLAAVTALAGCGEDSGTAQRAWAEKADACRRAIDAVTSRGTPHDTKQLAAAARSGYTAVGRVRGEIERLARPQRAGVQIERVLSDLIELEGVLGTVEAAAMTGNIDSVESNAVDLQAAWPRYGKDARDAGLRTCLRPEHERIVTDAAFTAILPRRLARFNHWLTTRQNRILRRPALQTSAAAAERALADLAELYDAASERAGLIRAPARGDASRRRLTYLLSQTAEVFAVAAEQVHRNGATATMRAALERRLDAKLRRMYREYTALLESVGITDLRSATDEDAGIS